MITKQEIISVATNLELMPTSIEKDYVLGWVLYGISQQSILSNWLFKGGTCLKKCYFETYRFSEDLDFTVANETSYSKNAIENSLNDIAEIVYNEAGINLKTREIEVKESINKKNKLTFIAKLTYDGPLALPSHNQQRIRFDITNDEIIVDTPDNREVFHAYSDASQQPAKIKCYSINEILAEKTRAIYERQGRARDIYDVVNISRNFREFIDKEKTRTILNEKFEFKLLPKPTVDIILSRVDVSRLTANWDDQLKHQVQLLPPADSFYNELRQALSWWMDIELTEITLPTITIENKSQILPRDNFPTLPFSAMKKLGREINTNYPNNMLIDKIRYGARNRLCVEIEYDGITRLIEPYSLRKTKAGNILLYAIELKRNNLTTNSIKSYKIEHITKAGITQHIFVPSYVVEL